MGPGRYLQDHFGFTRHELRLLLVLAAVTLAGILLRLLTGAGTASAPVPRLAPPPARDTAGADTRPPLRSGGHSRTDRGRGPERPAPTGRPLNLNTADRDALLGLPGIGPVYADRILAARAHTGGFRSVEDLLAVRGIGPKTLARLRPLVCVDSARAP